MARGKKSPIELTKMCMKAEGKIWKDLGIICGCSSDPKRSTVATNRPAYEGRVRGWLENNRFMELDLRVLESICEILYLEGFHSFREVLKEMIGGD